VQGGDDDDRRTDQDFESGWIDGRDTSTSLRQQASECSPWRGAAEPGDAFGKTNRACEAGDRIIPISDEIGV